MKNTIEMDKKNQIQNNIDIKKLLNDLEKNGSENEKEEFIKNYSRIKEEIKIVDNILNFNNPTDTKDFETKTIDELFKILENSENKIFDNEILTIQELKSLIDVSNVLEKKINDDTMTVIDIK